MQPAHNLPLRVSLELPLVDPRNGELKDLLRADFAPAVEITRDKILGPCCQARTIHNCEASAHMRHFSTSAPRHSESNRSVAASARVLPIRFPKKKLGEMEDQKVVAALKQLDTLQNSINNFFTSVYGAIDYDVALSVHGRACAGSVRLSNLTAWRTCYVLRSA